MTDHSHQWGGTGRGPIATELAQELRVLAKGRGARPGQSLSHVGPILREVCLIAREDSALEAIDAVASWLRGRTALLASDFRMYAEVAFALHPEAPHLLLTERVAWVSERLCHTERTTRRKIDKVIWLIAATTSMHVHGRLAQLHAHVGSLVVMTIRSTAAGNSVQRCLLLAVARHVDRSDSYFAVIRVDGRAVLAVPAVRIHLIAPATP